MLASFNLTDSRPFVCGKGQKLCMIKNVKVRILVKKMPDFTLIDHSGEYRT